MLRHCLLLFGLVTAIILSTGGCRSCSSCHDYDPPVANCDCHACGTQRSGSASGDYVSDAYAGELYDDSNGNVVNPPSDQQGNSKADGAR